MIQRLLAVWHARNLEFVRDRTTMIFTLLLPIMLVVGMSFVFGGKERPLFKVGVLATASTSRRIRSCSERYVEFVPITDQAAGLRKVTHQQIDLLLDLHGAPRYWVNTDSPKGYIVEKLLLAAAAGAQRAAGHRRRRALCRLAVPRHPRHEHDVQLPLRRGLRRAALSQERLSQAPACDAADGVRIPDRPGALAPVPDPVRDQRAVRRDRHDHPLSHGRQPAAGVLIALLGALSMIALGLTIAARFSSEELVGGLLNLLTWPMMLLSGIWYLAGGLAAVGAMGCRHLSR